MVTQKSIDLDKYILIIYNTIQIIELSYKYTINENLTSSMLLQT